MYFRPVNAANSGHIFLEVLTYQKMYQKLAQSSEYCN